MRTFVAMALWLFACCLTALPSHAAFHTHSHSLVSGHTAASLSPAHVFCLPSSVAEPDTTIAKQPHKRKARHNGWRGPTSVLLGGIGVLCLFSISSIAWLPAICAVVVGALGLRPGKSARLLALLGLLLGLFVFYELLFVGFL